MSLVVVQVKSTCLTSDRLPFLEENNCTLGLAVKTYFDELATKPDPTSVRIKDEAKSKGSNWIAHCIDFADNLDTAFKLWDAVSHLSLPPLLDSNC